MIRGEYWWIYYRDDGIDWSHWITGVSEPVNQGSCKESLDIPAPDGASIILCIPGEQVRIHDVKAPARNRGKFLSSLPYALEDRLLHPPEDYHFVALAKNKTLKTVRVAVISKTYFDGILARFRQRDWQLLLVLPDYLYIEDSRPGTWTLDVTQTPFLLRLSDYPSGAAISGELAPRPPGALILALEQAESLPMRLQVRVSDTDVRQMVEQWSAVLEDYPFELEVIEDSRPRVTWLSRFPLPNMDMNLLTGNYAVRGQTRKQLMNFRPALGLAAAILLVLVAQWFIEGAQVESEYNRLQSEIEVTYRSVFPDARNLVDPRYQMQQQLLRLTSNSEFADGKQFDFLVALDQLASILGNGNSQLQGVEYDGTNIVIDVSLVDYEALERLQQQLAKTMQISIESAELEDGRVHSRISLEART